LTCARDFPATPAPTCCLAAAGAMLLGMPAAACKPCSIAVCYSSAQPKGGCSRVRSRPCSSLYKWICVGCERFVDCGVYAQAGRWCAPAAFCLDSPSVVDFFSFWWIILPALWWCLAGEEEIPEGVVGVLTPDAPDVLSHVSVRAQNMHVLFATCHDEEPLKEIKSMEGQ